MKKTFSILAVAACAATALHATPPVAYDLAAKYGVNVGRSDWWYSLASGSYPTNNWASSTPEDWNPLASQWRLNETDPAASIVKLANLGGGIGSGPELGGQSIYFKGGGTLGVVADNPLAGVRTVFLQLSMGEAWGESLLNGEFPVLQVVLGADAENPVTIQLEQDRIAQMERIYENKMPVPPPGEGEVDNYINLWGFQWDIPALYSNITEISVSFSAVPHVALYQVQLDQSTQVYNSFAIPEPATYALLLSAGVLGLVAVRRRRAR